jgi:hypothetical protein
MLDAHKVEQITTERERYPMAPRYSDGLPGERGIASVPMRRSSEDRTSGQPIITPMCIEGT